MSSRSEHAQPISSRRPPLSRAVILLLLLLLTASTLLSVQGTIGATSNPTAQRITFVANVPGPSAQQKSVPVEVYIPKGVSIRQQTTVLVALHGMGGNGAEFASPLYDSAEELGWIVVAPTFQYDSYLDVRELTDDDFKAIAALRAILAQLPEQTSLRIGERVLLYGFSRGAQLAHRFALLYPGEVLGVASLSAGAYTLPTDRSPNPEHTDPLRWPIGIADLAAHVGHDFEPERVRGVRFFVGVGTRDDQPRDVARDWDGCSGTTRVTRATTFAEALDALGAPVQLVQFPNAGHKETPEMRRVALEYLADAAAQAAE